MPHKDTWEKSPGGMWRPCGDLQPIIITQPAVGANISYQLASGNVFKFISLRMVLVVDATAVSRFVVFRFEHGGEIFFQASVAGVQSASQTRTHCLAAFGNYINSADTTHMIPSPPDFFVPGGTRITTVITNLQAGDQISAAVLYVERFPGDEY